MNVEQRLGQRIEQYLADLDARRKGQRRGDPVTVPSEQAPTAEEQWVFDLLAGCREYASSAPPPEATARILATIEQACGASDEGPDHDPDAIPAEWRVERGRAEQQRSSRRPHRRPERVGTLALASDAHTFLDEQLRAVHELVLPAVVRRGFAFEDAQDVVQEVLLKIARDPSRFADKLEALDEHAGYFIWMALAAYKMRLRGERRRLGREERHVPAAGGFEGSAPGDGPTAEDVLALASGAALTDRQRQYVSYVFDDHLSIEQIAARTSTTPRAVRAVLQRAAERIRVRLLTE